MENMNGVLYDGTFYYKDLTNAVKLSWSQMNHNFEQVKLIRDDIKDDRYVVEQALESVNQSKTAAAASATAANNAKTAAESAKNTAVSANASAQSAKTAAESARDTAVSANTSAQAAATTATNAKTAAESARNTAQTSATTATNAKNAAETARTTATQKATEASASAAAAAQSAADAAESASAVTSVQGKQGVVSLVRTDFNWMGNAAEATLAASVTDETVGRVLRVGDHGIGTKGGISLGEGVNLNTYQTNGFYSQAANARALANLNYPAQVAGTLLVLSASAAITTQTYTAYNDGRVWTRSRYNTTWSTWQLHYSSFTLAQATQAEIDAGTQVASRLFSPKQLADTFSVKSETIEFLSSSDWAKPAGCQFVKVEAIGGGGAGGGSQNQPLGGGGGAYAEYVFSAAELPNSVSVLVGGASGSSGFNGILMAGGGAGYQANSVGGRVLYGMGRDGEAGAGGVPGSCGLLGSERGKGGERGGAPAAGYVRLQVFY